VRTPEDFRRDDVKSIFKRRLKEDVINLKPLSIKIEENLLSDKTIVDLSFEKKVADFSKTYTFQEVMGSGFVDAMFKACYTNFIEDYKSLRHLTLVDVIVKPIFSMSRSEAKTDAKTDVIFRIETKNHGISEFRSRSRSIVYSSLESMLRAFQFYMNCDKTFNQLQEILKDAKSRNRGDIAQNCISDLATLAGVNCYV
jgi:hypothetical protein|tara:strand:+ start:3371 stop:3964 length:594 start_codon:yes stop_codon:yes gene_type:complete